MIILKFSNIHWFPNPRYPFGSNSFLKIYPCHDRGQKGARAMTIDAGWTKIIKKNVPSAFFDSFSHVRINHPSCVFIDGQIKMMKSDAIKTWGLFIKIQFVCTVQNAFDKGAEVVVLGFDNYKYVPSCKSMTQQKRSRAVPAMEFIEGQELPAIPPVDWNSAMRNRVFKSRVMQLICRNMKEHFETTLKNQNKTLVIDYHDVPEVIGFEIDLPDMLTAGLMQDQEPRRGECDIKAFTWMNQRDSLLVESTDGDFIPIALIQLEDREKQCIANNDDDKAEPPNQKPDVVLHRMKTHVSPAGAKRNSDGKTKREYEYVQISPILIWVTKCFPNYDSPARAFANLVATTGCDFAMNLPQIGPTTLWASLPLTSKHDVTTREGLMNMLASIYHKSFSKKNDKVKRLSLSDQLYPAMFTEITKDHRVTERIRNNLFSPHRMLAHVKNTSWTVEYWANLHAYPDPLADDFGFEQHKRCVIFSGTNH